MRTVEHRLPASSLITISCTATDLPILIGVHTPVTVPDRAEPVCVALMSSPTPT